MHITFLLALPGIRAVRRPGHDLGDALDGEDKRPSSTTHDQDSRPVRRGDRPAGSRRPGLHDVPLLRGPGDLAGARLFVDQHVVGR
jgi:hypothetical protein